MGTAMGMTGRSVRTENRPYLCLAATFYSALFELCGRPVGNTDYSGQKALFTCWIPGWAPPHWRRWRGRRAPALSVWSRRRDSATPAASGSSPRAARLSAGATAAGQAAPDLKTSVFFIIFLSMFLSVYTTAAITGPGLE
jgi:hypothetical protein